VTPSISAPIRVVPLLALAFALAIGLAAPRTAMAQDADGAADFIQTLGETAIQRLGNQDVPESERRDAFRRLLQDGFAMEAISRFVLGRYWRVASPEEQQRFQDTFERVLTQRFLPLFSGYDRDDFVVEGAGKDPAQPSLYAVSTRVAQPNAPDAEKVRVTWRVRPSDGAYEIVDVKAEGVSMAITLRSEYNSAIKRAGGNVSRLIAQLEDNLAQGAYTPDEVGDVTK
jgi:phospholipid transport system substrate-binding protein